jgi:hypothetical protein
MSETLLISLIDFAPYKALSTNLTTVKNLDPYILEAQEFDLKKLLGRELFIDLLDDFDASPSLTKYEDLFNGLSYEYQDVKYQHRGLVPVLCYYSYARYILNSGGHSTDYGLRKKINQDSEEVSEKEKARRVTQAREGAVAYWNDVKVFLDHYKIIDPDTYEFWNCTTKGATGLPRINGIG